MGTWTGAETEAGTGLGQGCRPVDQHSIGTGMEAGTKKRAASGNWNGEENGNGTGTRIGSGRAEERRISAINRPRVVDVIWEIKVLVL